MTHTHSTDFELNRDGGTLSVHVPMTFRKRGGRKLVISPAGTPDTPPSRPGRSSSVDESLVRTLAQAFQWKQLLDNRCLYLACWNPLDRACLRAEPVDRAGEVVAVELASLLAGVNRGHRAAIRGEDKALQQGWCLPPCLTSPGSGIAVDD